jgi:carbon-monoxide dehydrogenase medium subunit
VEEATALLVEHGDGAAAYCGGTELLLLMKLGFAAFDHLVDLKGIEELRGIAAENGGLRIGATSTHRELEHEPVVRELLPALAAMERDVANVRVRTVGTLGGNLCFSDPHSDPATFLLALDAEVETRHGARGGRRRPLREFLVGPYQVALEPGELLAAVHVPLPRTGAVVVHDKFAFHERPAATVTCVARIENGVIAEARVAVGSVGPSPVRAADAERLLVGAQPGDDTTLAQAAERAAEAAGAVDDAMGSAEYKAQLVRVLVRRGMARARAAG